MFKILLVLRMVTTENRTEVYVKNDEMAFLSTYNPNYKYYNELLTFSMNYREPVGVLLLKKNEIQTVFSSESGTVSSINISDGWCKISMLPLAGIYKLATGNSQYESIYINLVKSKKNSQKIRIFLKQATTEIVYVYVEE